MASAHRSCGEVYQAGDLLIDLGRQCVMRRGVKVPMPRRSFEFLVALARAYPRMLSVDELMDTVWAPAVVNPETVNQRVKLLRQSLGDDPANPQYVVGIRGRGYRMDAAVTCMMAEAVDNTLGGHHSAAAVEGFPSAPQAIVPSRQRHPLFVFVLALALGVSSAATVMFWSGDHPKRSPTASIGVVSTKSVAVLPFVDMSERQDQQYFADGMAEEIINLLAKVPDLQVSARTSSFYFKGKPTKVPDIARELGVAHVLEGSIRRSGDRLRVTAELVRADNGFHLWSETYDRDVDDVFTVQDDIANAVAQRLELKLTNGPLSRQGGGTQDLRAYKQFLQARSAFEMNSKTSLEVALTGVNNAIKLDPEYALAWILAASITVEQTDIGVLPPEEGFERARQLAQHALKLRPNLAEAHFILEYVHRSYDRDWLAAEAEGRRGLALDPTNTLGLVVAGMLSKTLGRWDDAERQLSVALIRDPLFSYAHYNMASVLYGAHRFAEAEAYYRKLLDVAPGFLWTRRCLAKTLLAEGRAAEALAMAQQEVNEELRLDILAIVTHATGRNAEADEALTALLTKYADSDAYYVAMTYAYRDDHDHTFEWLERAYAQKDTGLMEFVGEPLFNNVMNDVRYTAFLRKMKLRD